MPELAQIKKITLILVNMCSITTESEKRSLITIELDGKFPLLRS